MAGTSRLGCRRVRNKLIVHPFGLTLGHLAPAFSLTEPISGRMAQTGRRMNREIQADTTDELASTPAWTRRTSMCRQGRDLMAVHLHLSEQDRRDGESSRPAYTIELGQHLGDLDARLESVAGRHLLGQHLAQLASR